jgi:hypothetical protein
MLKRALLALPRRTGALARLLEYAMGSGGAQEMNQHIATSILRLQILSSAFSLL